MRTTFDGQIALLHKELIEMGALCEESIAISAKALDKGDSELAKEVFDYTVKIDQKARDIETMCIRLFMKQQPVAKDLRVISSALKMVTDIERIGVNSGDIAEIVTMGHISAEQDKLNIKDMACSTIKMVTDSIDSFVQNDMELAKSVIEYDDVVDSSCQTPRRTGSGKQAIAPFRPPAPDSKPAHFSPAFPPPGLRRPGASPPSPASSGSGAPPPRNPQKCSRNSL